MSFFMEATIEKDGFCAKLMRNLFRVRFLTDLFQTINRERLPYKFAIPSAYGLRFSCDKQRAIVSVRR